jgi:hypothetical protein
VHFPVAGWVFNFTLGDDGSFVDGGWITYGLQEVFGQGVIDFAGGTAVHINSDAAALALAAGLKDDAIARQLSTTTRTVRRRVQAVLTARGARSRFSTRVSRRTGAAGSDLARPEQPQRVEYYLRSRAG